MSTTVETQISNLAEVFEIELEAYIAAELTSTAPILREGVRYVLGLDVPDRKTRGKRLRPVLCLMTAGALSAPHSLAMPFALAIEFMHNFALVHDDIEDGDVMRRGRDAAWTKYGLPHAINLGDYLLVHMNRSLTHWGDPNLCPELRYRLLELITQALDHTHVGQALDIEARAKPSCTMADYERTVLEKTGYYLAAPIQGGAIVAGSTTRTLAVIEQLAHELGPLFQIMDDLIDLSDGKGREAIGGDIREGKRSFMVAWTWEKAGAEDRQRLMTILDRPREETTPENIGEVIALFRQYDAIEAAQSQCRERHNRASGLLSGLPGPLASALSPVIDWLVDRKH